MQAEIIEALNAVRSAGHEFTKSFNHLSDIIEEMAKENESLHVQDKRKDEVIRIKEAATIDALKDLNSASARATKAEQDAWEMVAKVAKLEQDNARQSTVIADYTKVIYDRDQELNELRPMRSQRDIAFADLTTANATITSLRQEVSKLLEIILNVATSVDGVVNKPKPQEPAPEEPCYNHSGKESTNQSAIADTIPPIYYPCGSNLAYSAV